MNPTEATDPDPRKLALRDQLLTARGRLPLSERAERAVRIADHLMAAPEIRRAATVAAYVSIGREPGTGLLLDRLIGAGKRVILPVLLPDNDLDWGVYRGEGSLQRARFGLLEPSGPTLGPEAVAGADVVLVPGLAVDGNGLRLGRGGGSYDRTLARVPLDTFVCVVLNSEEILPRVPAEPHDRAVGAAVTELGITRFVPPRHASPEMT